MPGNAGGAKGPDFWRAFEEGEVNVNGGPKTSQLAAQKSANPARRFLTVWMW